MSDLKWEQRFVYLAEHISRWSKDPSTKCGAVITRSDRSVASLGFNGFPRQMHDTDFRYQYREEKYPRVIHAEMNAILSANEPVRGYTLHLFPALCCDRCAVHVAQAGISRVVYPASYEPREWGLRAEEYLKECGVELVKVVV